MNFQKKGLLTAIFLAFVSVLAQAQIINDTTKMLYGPTTTRILYERNFFRGNYEEVSVDTTIHNFYSNLYWFQDTLIQQSLGNIALATKPLTFQYSTAIGARPGRNAFDYYAYRSENLAYFDTRSPYTKLLYNQGTLGEGVFEAEFSRNIKKWWNIGFAYNRILAKKQIGATSRRDGQADHNGGKFYTHLQTTNNRYHLFANLLLMNHKWVESGGVKPNVSDVIPDDLFDFRSEDINLRQATGRDIRHSLHIGQTFGLFGEHLKLYHELDQKRQFDRFDDLELSFDTDTASGSTPTLFFYPDKINYDSLETHDRTTYNELQNTFGITGNQKHYFYKGYLKYRNASWKIHKPDSIFQNDDLPFNQTFNQVFVGGELEGRINNKFWGRFQAEYKLTDEYVTQAELKFLFLKFTQTRISAAPTLFQQTYFGNSYNWNNNFKNTTTDRTAIQVQGTKWHNRLRLEFASTVLNNYIIYNQAEQPEQLPGKQFLYTATLDHALAWGKFHWENTVVYSSTTDARFIRVPDLVANSRIFFQGFIFKKALFGQVGFEGTFRSDYYGDAYSPALQQFYLQDNFKLGSYPVVDFFVAADIKDVNIFLKLAHANESLNGPGYMATPYYPGMQRSFIFGIKWLFFD